MKDKKPRTMRVGTQIIRQLSTTFYPNIRMIFDELVSNARDAIATEVKIYIGTDKIMIEDNGYGMSPEELEKFFFISSTDKEPGEIKITGSIKRAIIGKFGIGKLSMYRICNKFEITTWRDGVTSRATFDFSEFESKKFVDEFELDVEEIGQQAKGHGTMARVAGT